MKIQTIVQHSVTRFDRFILAFLKNMKTRLIEFQAKETSKCLKWLNFEFLSQGRLFQVILQKKFKAVYILRHLETHKKKRFWSNFSYRDANCLKMCTFIYFQHMSCTIWNILLHLYIAYILYRKMQKNWSFFCSISLIIFFLLDFILSLRF